MDSPIYTYIPRWMSTIVESKICEKCQKQSNKKDICAIGVRSFGKKNDIVFYVEHQCTKCKARIITSFGAQKVGCIEEMCYILLEQLHAQRKIQKSLEYETQQKQGQMTDEEVELLLDFMSKSKSHEDFMKFIGSKECKPKNDED